MNAVRFQSPTTWLVLGLLTAFIGLVAVHWFGLNAAWQPIAGFLGALVGILFLFFAFGLAITENNILGILRSGNNTYSLSRLQMAAWTWLILSALIAVAVARLWNQADRAADALNIYIPSNLFLVMGISFFTGAASPALLSLKTNTAATPGQLATAEKRMGEEGDVVNHGQVIVRKLGQWPALGDFVEGEDLATAGTVDISKVQQLLITALLIGVYFAMLWDLFMATNQLWQMPEDLRKSLIEKSALLCGLADKAAAAKANCGIHWAALPDFPGSLVTLLAVSHGGYLAYKVAPRAAADNSGAATGPAHPDPAKLAG